MFTSGELEDLSVALVISEEQIPFKVSNHIVYSGLKSLQFWSLIRVYICLYTNFLGTHIKMEYRSAERKSEK